MATIQKVARKSGHAYRVIIRRKGHKAQSMTFDKKKDADAWARHQEGNLKEQDAYPDAIARQNLEPIHDQLTLLDREGEVVPGIGVLPAPGHTPGHVVVSVSSNDERLLYLGDVVMHVLHLEHPDWTPIYDIAPGQAQESRRALLDLATEERALVVGHHLAPLPSLGHVVKRAAGWQWQPIEVET